MTRDEITLLIREGRGLLARSGIRQRTVALALGLHESEVSMWVNRWDAPRRITPRGMRYVAFLAGLRRADINQAAAAVLLADNETCAGQAIREHASESPGGVGACRGIG